MFDSHCHLNDKIYLGKLNDVLGRSRNSGIDHFMIPGVDLPSSLEAIHISELFTGVFASVGIHPTSDLSGHLDEVIDKLEELIILNDIKAVGETGLDYYKFDYSPEIQKRYFIGQINLAQKYGLPVIVHTRHSEDDVLDILITHDYGENIILHCCPPDRRLLEYAITNKSHIGVCGDVTYDETKASFVRDIPLENLLIETDSPYLTPLPVRETVKFPNYPTSLIHIVKSISKIKKADESEIIRITSQNSRKVFGV